MKLNLTNILLIVVGGLLVFKIFQDNGSYEVVHQNSELLNRNAELENFNDELLRENADIKTERLVIDELEHEVEMFFDSSYVDEHTPEPVKDSILTDFFRQYHNIVGRRVQDGAERSDTTAGA